MSNRYRGHWIDPRAYELADGSGWSAEVYVAWDEGEDTIDSRFSLKEQFATRDAALDAAGQVGKRQVDIHIKSEDIRSVIDQAAALPSTHQHGYGSRSDDVAEGSDGLPTKVPTSENPEDRFN
jgi:hypothetical protein